MSENEKTELKFLGGLFRNESKKGDVYYSGKSEDGTQWVLFRNEAFMRSIGRNKYGTPFKVANRNKKKKRKFRK